MGTAQNGVFQMGCMYANPAATRYVPPSAIIALLPMAADTESLTYSTNKTYRNKYIFIYMCILF